MASNEDSEADAADAQAEEGDAAASPAPKKKRKLLIIIVAAVLLLGGGGAAAWFFLLRKPAAEAKTEAPEPPKADQLVDVAEMTVNLRTSDGGAKLLRVHLMLVPGSKTKEEVTASLPLVVDAFQPFLRELRPEDIAGSAATFRIKEEMLVRSNAVLGSGAVRDVLIQDLVQQ